MIKHDVVLCKLVLISGERWLHELSFSRLFPTLDHNVFFWIGKFADPRGSGPTVETVRREAAGQQQVNSRQQPTRWQSKPFLTSGDSIGFWSFALSGCQVFRFLQYTRPPASFLRVVQFSVTCRKTYVIGLEVLQAAKMDRSYTSTALPSIGHRQIKLLASEEM